MNRVRKARKACYVYSCELCGVNLSAPDLFRAYERQQGHERTIGHSLAEIARDYIRSVVGEES